MKKITLSIIIISLFAINENIAQTKYFQQHVNYNIKVELIPEEKKLTAYETITYTNNSPDTLELIYFHLWPNAYKNKHTALAKQMATNGNAKLYFNAKKIGGYIDNINFTSNNKKLKWNYLKKYIDICVVYLNTPLIPGKSVEISTPFTVKLPEDISRLGQKDSCFQITQWYPKPAVYDQNGWHPMPYLNIGEFYSEYGNFNVEITLPKQQVVAATGKLQTKNEQMWINKLVENVAKGYEIKNPAEKNKKTIQFTAENVHDFAWFCSEKYYVAKDSIITPNKKKKVTTWALFTDENYLEWTQVPKYINNAIKYYSKWIGDYPYQNCTAVEGALSAGAGMEYPQITVTTNASEEIITHEVGHNWFYGILGFNERRYPMLDEGINSFYDHRYTYEIKKTTPHLNNIIKLKHLRKFSYIMYQIHTFAGIDQPTNLHSSEYSTIAYSLITYEKMAQQLFYLQSYLGKQKFDSTMQAFFQKYKFTHPQPNDLEKFFKQNTTKNLNWFFNGYIKTNGKSDYKIKKQGKKFVLKNKGNFPAPIKLIGYKNNKIIDTTWIEPVEKKLKKPFDKTKYDKIIIDPQYSTMDFNRYNNYIKAKGLCKNFNKLKIRPIPGIADYYNKHLTIIPFPFYTKNTKLILGSLITNINFTPKKFSYYILPMYSFGHKTLIGTAHFNYRKYSYNGFPEIFYSLTINKYRYKSPGINFIPTIFRNIKAQIVLNLKNKNASDKYSKKIINNLTIIPNTTFKNPKAYDNKNSKIATTFFSLSFVGQKKSKFRPIYYKITADFLPGNYMLYGELNFKIHYNKLNNGLEIRLFSGSNVPATGTPGNEDFKYENFYWSKFSNYETQNKNIWAHQFNDNYGAITYYYPAQYFDFVNAINIKTTIYSIPIIKLYYNFVSTANLTTGYGLKTINFEPGLFDTGIALDIIPNIFSIYIPIYGSQKLMKYNKNINKNWYSNIRFTFKINDFTKFANVF